MFLKMQVKSYILRVAESVVSSGLICVQEVRMRELRSEEP